MKILFVLHLPPPIHGPGIVGDLIKESHVINNSFDCRFINLSTSADINEIGKNPLKKLFRYYKIIFKVIGQLIIFRPDMCYVTPYTVKPGLYKDAFIIMILKLRKQKIVFHLHNKGIIDRQSSSADDFLYKVLFRNSRTILLSDYLYGDISKYVPEEHIYYCANGIPEKGASIIEKDYRKTPGLLFLSNLIRSKGLEYLIEACYILKERNLSFQCIISGRDGDLSAGELKKEIKSRGLDGIVSVCPPAYGSEKQKLMLSADIFVHPSFNDCMPLTLIEAMQYALPVVSTFEGAIPDVVSDGKTGILVRQKDSIALADAIEKLICDPVLRQQLGKNGYRKYREQFTIEKFEGRLTEILNEIGKN